MHLLVGSSKSSSSRDCQFTCSTSTRSRACRWGFRAMMSSGRPCSQKTPGGCARRSRAQGLLTGTIPPPLQEHHLVRPSRTTWERCFNQPGRSPRSRAAFQLSWEVVARYPLDHEDHLVILVEPESLRWAVRNDLVTMHQLHVMISDMSSLNQASKNLKSGVKAYNCTKDRSPCHDSCPSRWPSSTLLLACRRRGDDGLRQPRE